MRLGKTVKTRKSDVGVALERRMIGLEQALVLDCKRCCGCLDCEKICPTEAISSTEPVVGEGRLKNRVKVDVNPEACTFCGQCAVVCPTKAISWRENDNAVPNVVSGGILPALDESIDIKKEDCRIDCGLACRTVCPVEAVNVKTEGEGAETAIVDVSVDGNRCLFCGKCEDACPLSLISVKKSRLGLVHFAPENCPSTCQACADACPTGAMVLEEGGVKLYESFCIYCGSCLNVCPVNDALEVKRERIQGLPLRSQLWLGIQGKIISPAARIRLIREHAELKRQRAFRTRID